MPDQVAATSTVANPFADLSLSAEEIYDRHMQEIEPELVRANLPLLAEKYKNETPEQAKARAERYDKAFKEYDRRMQEWSAKLAEEAKRMHKDAMQSVEKEDHDEGLANAEALLSALPS